MERYRDILDAQNQAANAYDPNYASFWERLGATVIDSIIISIPTYLVFFLAFLGADLEDPATFEDNVNIGLLISSYGIMFLMAVLYPVLMECSKYRATIGKMALRLQVNNRHGGKISFGQALGRYFGKMVSALPIYIGFLMPLWDSERQTIHDKMANTWVVRRP